MSEEQKVKKKNGNLSETGWPAGSIGDVSAQLGYDIRDLKMAGYSDEEINEVLYGQRTLEDLLSSKPRHRGS